VRDGRRIVSVIDPGKVLELGGHYVFVRPDRGNLDTLAQLVDEGKVRVHVSEMFSLDEFADAHRASEKGAGPGKIVVRI